MRSFAFLAIAVLGNTLCFAAGPGFGSEGMLLATGMVPDEITLVNGVTVRASPRSSGTLFSDHLVLAEGAVHLDHFSGYTVDARELHIQAQNPESEAVVRVSANTIEVASLAGSLDVSADGAMLTRVVAGTRISFQPRAASGRGHSSERHILLWIIGITAVAALAIGLTAAAQGKSPF